jgi:hypothetical protein
LTIAISLKVNDAVVLAADSATTFFRQVAAGQPPEITKVYNHADKIVNLYKGLPIGMMTWGSANIGPASIATLAKDLRRRLEGNDPKHKDWALKTDAYTVKDVAQRAYKFLYKELYEPTFASWAEKPDLGFLIAGFSADEGLAEEWEIAIASPSGACPGPTEAKPMTQTGWLARGLTMPLGRLLIGFDYNMVPDFLSKKLPPKTDLDKAVNELRAQTEINLVQAAMPLQDAIDLAIYFVQISHGFSRFAEGAAVVGGAIDVAAITKHEGFKWVHRKHYYRSELNPQIAQ